MIDIDEKYTEEDVDGEDIICEEWIEDVVDKEFVILKV